MYPGDGLARDEQGVATLALPLLVWATLLVAIVLIDAAAYLVAAARAQTAADGAALAAVSADLTNRSPNAAALRVTQASAADLESCSCRRGSSEMTTEVSVAVEGLVIPTLGAARVSATSRAAAVHPTVTP